MRQHLILLLALARAAAVLQCPVALTEEQLPIISRDLLPWVHGIDAALWNSTVSYALNDVGNAGIIGPCSSALVVIKNGTVSFSLSNKKCNNTPAYPLVTALPNFLSSIAVEAALPDSAFIVSVADKPDNDNTHTHFQAIRRPVFHFCRTADAADILTETYIVHMDKGLRHLVSKLSEHPLPAWAEKKDVLFGAWTSFGRWVYKGEIATMRFGLDGEENYDARATIEKMGLLLNDSRVQINTNGFVPAWEWGKFRYVVFMDGVTCSNKIYELLLSGSLVFVEQSGYECLPLAHLRPFEHYIPFYHHFPQELGWAWAWAQQHPARAESIAAAGHAWALRHLHPDALACRWQTLLGEYNKLFTFNVVEHMQHHPFHEAWPGKPPAANKAPAENNVRKANTP